MKTKPNKLIFYTMLYLKSENATKNLAENSRAKLEGYIRCCEVLRDSLRAYGHGLILLTNSAETILNINNDLKVKKIDFKLDVPSDIKFYSAHYKIDVFKYLSEQGDNYSILLDCDVVCINKLPLNIDYLISRNIPMYYDITNQRYPRYGREKLIQDKSILMNKPSIGNWSGGEFIGGGSEFFGNIYLLCMKYWESYKIHFKTIHHQGDEMITSCAIEEYQLGGNIIFNVDSVGGISRYWSIPTLHVQKNYKSIFDNFLIHLPDDKNFISRYNFRDSKQFLRSYKQYIKRKRWKNYVYGKIKTLFFSLKN